MKKENGNTLIEDAISLALIGIIIVAFMGALSTGAQAFLITNKKTTANNLAETQMEDIKKQGYITPIDYDPGTPGSGEAVYTLITSIPESYDVMSVNRTGDIVEEIIGIPWDNNPDVDQPVDSDLGLQKIRLVIRHNDRDIKLLEGYKVKR